LALAYVPDAGKLSKVTAENKDTVLKGVTQREYANYEGDATLLGFVAIKDPVRPEVKPAIDHCRTAGIRVIMITGDAKSTAIAVAKELNILEAHQDEKECCFTGVEFAALSEEKRKQILGSEGGRVFSRVEPRHKRELVKSLQEMGQVVAMTGDGVNDAPALK
jgi:magnesium-transporting ATPase (P-type)